MAVKNLADYKGLDIKRDEVPAVTKEQVQAEVDKILQQHVMYAEVTGRGVENGDTAVIDFEGFKDGVAFEGGKAEKHPLVIGSGSFIPGFEEQVIGMNVGEERDINVSFPDSYHVEDLKGAPVVFKIKLHEIKAKKENELNDEFAASLGFNGVTNLEQLKLFIKGHISSKHAMEAENKYIDKLLQNVADNSDIDVPMEMVNNEIEMMIKNFEQQLAGQGANLEMYFQATGLTEEKMKADMLENATKSCAFKLVIDEIANRENITVSEEEIDATIAEIASAYGMDAAQLKPMLGDLSKFETELKGKKAIELLVKAN